LHLRSGPGCEIRDSGSRKNLSHIQDRDPGIKKGSGSVTLEYLMIIDPFARYRIWSNTSQPIKNAHRERRLPNLIVGPVLGTIPSYFNIAQTRAMKPVPLRTLDSVWVKNQDPDPGSGFKMNNPDHISESLETIFCFTIFNFFDANPGSGMEKIRIRDKHPGSATLHETESPFNQSRNPSVIR
jgi:hypothetical protein